MLATYTLTCPHCQGTNVFLSHRRLLERAVTALVGLRPYRCTDCHYRFWRRKNL